MMWFVQEAFFKDRNVLTHNIFKIIDLRIPENKIYSQNRHNRSEKSYKQGNNNAPEY